MYNLITVVNNITYNSENLQSEEILALSSQKGERIMLIS